MRMTCLFLFPISELHLASLEAEMHNITYSGIGCPFCEQMQLDPRWKHMQIVCTYRWESIVQSLSVRHKSGADIEWQIIVSFLNVLNKLIESLFSLKIVYLVPDWIILNYLVKSTYFSFTLHILKIDFVKRVVEVLLNRQLYSLFQENKSSTPPPGVPLHCMYCTLRWMKPVSSICYRHFVH